MEKILISVYIPYIEKTFEVFVPINITVSKCIELIQKAIQELSLGSYQINPQAMLYSRSDFKVIAQQEMVKTSGLKNGITVVLL